MWIDSHAHLYALDDDTLRSTLQRAGDAGVGHILNTGVSIDTGMAVIRQCAGHGCLSAAVGISPFDAANLSDGWRETLLALLNDSSVVAIGETGIDATNPSYPTLALQTMVFEEQLLIAVSRDIPIIIHSRGAEIKAFEMCRAAGAIKAVFHCFTGDRTALKRILDGGYFVSFSGIITFKNSGSELCVEYAPLSQMLIETDSPYLTPVPHRGKTNEPGLVGLVGAKVAEIKKVNPAEVAEVLRNNFETLFGLKHHA
jgi:TatD DNase family protein